MSSLLSRIQARNEAEPPEPGVALSPSELIRRSLMAAGTTLEKLREEAADEMVPEEGKKRLEFVPETAEFRRIRDLPRRKLEDLPETLVQEFTETFKTGSGNMELRPIQALALHDIYLHQGLFGPMRVGAGKTLVTYLAPSVLDAKRPLLVLPAKLKEKTRREFRQLASHWHGPNPDGYRIVSYELLGRPQSGAAVDGSKPGLLERYRPDLIVFDEAHKVANKRAAVTKRVSRYLKENPGVPVIAVSGTMTKRSIKDYAHISEWCFAANLCPLPVRYTDLEAWADALDEKTNVFFKRPDPGILLSLCNEEEKKEPDRLTAARRAFRRRLVETPGCVATQDGALGVSLSISALEPIRQDEITEDHFTKLRTDWETPDGWPLTDAIEMWRHARELAIGFYYVWDPRPPMEWLERRKAWAKFCREVLKYNRRGLDSEAQVVHAVDLFYKGKKVEGALDDGGLLRAWRDIRNTFIPQTKAVWFSTEALDTAAKWMDSNPGLVWVEHVSFGEELSRKTGVPYYGKEGRDPKKRYIEDHPKGKPLICSVASNSEGRNLQHRWSQNLIVSAPPNGRITEQLLGRTHRDGQLAEEVTAEWYLGCWEHASGFWQAKKDAEYAQTSQGQAQKLCYADLDFPDLWDVEKREGFRWSKT